MKIYKLWYNGCYQCIYWLLCSSATGGPGSIHIMDVINVYIGCYVHQQRVAQEVLTRLKEHPDAWTRVDTILEFSSNQQTKYYALQILENVIKTRWKVLPRTQCEGKWRLDYTITVFTLGENMFQSLEWMDQYCISPLFKCLSPCDQSRLLQGKSINTRTDYYQISSVLFKFVSIKNWKVTYSLIPAIDYSILDVFLLN